MPRSKKPKKEKFFNTRGFIISQLRRSFRRYPPYYQTLHEGRKEYYIPSKTGKPMKRVLYTCKTCKEDFKQSDIRVDHIDPIVDEKGFPLTVEGKDDYNTYIPKLYCEKSNLQRICKVCHDIKSKAEQKARREYTKLTKDKK